MTFGTLIAE